MADVADLIRSARLPERTVPLCLRGDLAAEHEELCARLAEEQQKNLGSLAGNPGARALAEDITALEALMAEATIGFRLRALPRREWAELVAKHPPRRDDGGRVLDADRVGVNADDFMTAILHRCVVEPILTEEDWDALVNEGLTDAQYEQLTDAVWALNRRDVDVPFSLAASTILRGSVSA